MFAEKAFGILDIRVSRFRDCFVHREIGDAHQEAEDEQHDGRLRPLPDCPRLVALGMAFEGDLDHCDNRIGER